jgi:hypothetical protein
MDKVLEKGVLVRYKITSLKYLNNDFVSDSNPYLLERGGHR